MTFLFACVAALGAQVFSSARAANLDSGTTTNADSQTPSMADLPTSPLAVGLIVAIVVAASSYLMQERRDGHHSAVESGVYAASEFPRHHAGDRGARFRAAAVASPRARVRTAGDSAREPFPRRGIGHARRNSAGIVAVPRAHFCALVSPALAVRRGSGADSDALHLHPGPMLSFPDRVLNLSVPEQVPSPLEQDPQYSGVWILTLLTAVLFVLGFIGARRRSSR